jgi:hypothetical protein
MNLIKKLLNLKRTAPLASKPEVETEEVPTMILDGAQFYTYRRFRMANGTSPQATQPAVHLPSSR